MPIIRESLVSQRLIEIDSPNIVVSALKRSEDHESLYILRIYEDRGEQTVAKVKINLDLNQRVRVSNIQLMNSLEDPIEDTEKVLTTFDDGKQELIVSLRPYKFITIGLTVSVL